MASFAMLHDRVPSSSSFLLLLNLLLFTSSSSPVASSSWTASTILDIAADLLQPGSSDVSPQMPDPLLHPHHPHPSSSSSPPDTQRQNLHHLQVNEENEVYLLPILNGNVGDNNQLMEYMAATLVARATNRTLCLTPFFPGPSRHTKKLPTAGLAMEDRYDMELFSKFVNISSLERCLQECKNTINGFWWLHKTSYMLSKKWTFSSEMKTHDLAWSYVNWTSIEHIRRSFISYNDEKCVAIGGLFPGFRWRGAYLAPSLFMQPSESISMDATTIQNIMIGPHSFLAIHWRFEESICKDHRLGLCFLRCGDGSVIDSGLHPITKDINITYEMIPREKCIHDARGVIVTQVDIVEAIYTKAIEQNVSTIYLATDGWMRGASEKKLIKEVLEELGKRQLRVVGLWRDVDGLQNLAGYEGQPDLDLVMQRRSGHAISEVEQEICRRAKAFMGSGQSTWSLSVFRQRIANRLRSLHVDEEQMIASALADSHAAGLQCRYNGYFRRAHIKDAQEQIQDEAPDSWLDVEACEARALLNPNGTIGSCKLTACSSS